jgi:hypothetical protein
MCCVFQICQLRPLPCSLNVECLLHLHCTSRLHSALPIGSLSSFLLLSLSICPVLSQSRAPIKAAVRRYEWLLSVNHQDPNLLQLLKPAALQYQLRMWWDEKDASIPVKLLKFEPGPSKYLTHDKPKAASRRARLRFDRSSLNLSMSRRRCSNTSLCPVCHITEDADHVLHTCPSYDVARHACQAAFAYHNIPFQSSYLLGEVSPLPPRVQASILDASASFLQTITRIGPIVF